ncbi:MAG: hypothetical protein KAI43_06585 [Candidatus Aureabacteria bacterium]|nr:hypothetical protein [Candidatus Auribacterota bacterium]
MTDENMDKKVSLQNILKGYGFEDKYLYLLDVVPLIEIAWADGIIQVGELGLIKEFIVKHIENINKGAGVSVISRDEGVEFIERFTVKRPDPELMKVLRSMVVPLRLQSAEASKNTEQKLNILKFCMDIAASSVIEYPYGSHERFCDDEKAIFLEIMKNLGISPTKIV